MGYGAEITDTQLALLVDIAGNAALLRMTPKKSAELDVLLDGDFIARRDGGEQPGSGDFYLTRKGEIALAELGVGPNES